MGQWVVLPAFRERVVHISLRCTSDAPPTILLLQQPGLFRVTGRSIDAVLFLHYYSCRGPSLYRLQVVPVYMRQATVPALYIAATGNTPHTATLVNPI